MVNYQNGKIYKIWSSQTENIYIGSTTKLLCQRLAKHKHNYNYYLHNKYGYCKAYEIIKYDDCKIELMELYPCNSKEELLKREGELIREHKNICCNLVICGRTQQEYREEHKEKLDEYNKKYREENKEHKSLIDKKYREEHKEELNDKKKKYYQDHKEEISQKAKLLLFSCECGSQIRKDGLSLHLKSAKHQKYLRRNA